MSTSWSDLANENPFEKQTKPNVETSESTDIQLAEQAAYIENFVVATTDGRTVPVKVDNGTRSVYPIRASKN